MADKKINTRAPNFDSSRNYTVCNFNSYAYYQLHPAYKGLGK